MKKVLIFIFFFFLIIMTVFAESPPERHPDSGIYAIWYGPDQDKLDKFPFLVGGQVYRKWNQIEKSEGVYDFSSLDSRLRDLHQKGLKTTIQLNAEQPNYLFDKVPYLTEKLKGCKHELGTLMYWHPTYKAAYKNVLEALAQHLKNSPYKDAILGIRMNYNAIGTENTKVDEEYWPEERWITPQGVTFGNEYTDDVPNEYKHWVLQTYMDLFYQDFYIFVRNNIFTEDILTDSEINLIRTGKLGLFHTSSAIQPNNNEASFSGKKYMAFYDYCRPGYTLCYAESYSDARQSFIDKQDFPLTDPGTPVQWVYWTNIVNLHYGISFPAPYYTDLELIPDPEAIAAFDFLAKYSGYHADPVHSPGAWVAFREGDFLVGDYNFLMERTEPDSSIGKYNVGKDTQRQGIWARQLNAPNTIVLNLNNEFQQSLNTVNVSVTYLDSGTGRFETSFSGKDYTTTLANTGDWKTVTYESEMLNSPTIELKTLSGNVIFHMVEVTRTDSQIITCEEGLIVSECLCGGDTVSSGYCCSGVLQQNDCTINKMYTTIKSAQTFVIDGDCSEFNDAKIEEVGGSSEFKMMWDMTNLYICANVDDGLLTATNTQRDSDLWLDDSIELFIDSQGDKGTKRDENDFKFIVNVLNTKSDTRGTNKTWNAIWESAVKTTSTGYNLEVSIPWSEMEMTPLVGDLFGFDIRVNDKETSSVDWSNSNGASPNDPNGWGTVRFTHMSDTDFDGCVEIHEISSFIDSWKRNDYDLVEVLNSIKLWKKGCS